MKHTLIFLFLLVLIGCKFNETTDPNVPLLPHPPNVEGFADTTAFKTDTLFDHFVVKVPAHFIAGNKGVLPGAGVGGFEMLYARQDTSCTISITWANRKRKGGEVDENDLNRTSENFKMLIKNYKGGQVGKDQITTIAGKEFLRLDAELNWEGYRRGCTWISTVDKGRLFLIDAKYPLRDVEAATVHLDEILQSIELLE